MSEVKHTPLPWSFPQEVAIGDIVFGADGFQIADIGQGPHVSKQWAHKGYKKEHWCVKSGVHHREVPQEEIEANAAFIVRACNSYYDMVGALEAIRACKSQISPEVLAVCEQAITAAKGAA